MKESLRRSLLEHYPHSSFKEFEPLTHDEQTSAQRRIEEITAELKAMAEADKKSPAKQRNGRPLLEAARFVLDVDGDPTAMQALREAVEDTEAWLARMDRREGLIQERDFLTKRLSGDRCFVYGKDGRVFCSLRTWPTGKSQSRTIQFRS